MFILFFQQDFLQIGNLGDTGFFRLQGIKGETANRAESGQLQF